MVSGYLIQCSARPLSARKVILQRSPCASHRAILAPVSQIPALLRASQVISTAQLCEGPGILEGWNSLQWLPDRARAGPESEAKETPLKPIGSHNKTVIPPVAVTPCPMPALEFTQNLPLGWWCHEIKHEACPLLLPFLWSIITVCYFTQNARIHMKLRQDIEMDQTFWHPGTGGFLDASTIAPSLQDRKALSFTPASQM